MATPKKIVTPPTGPQPGASPSVPAESKPRFQKPTDEQLENRYSYHAPKGDQAERYAKIRAAILETAKLIRDLTPCSPEQSTAFTALDSAMFNANAAIARNE